MNTPNQPLTPPEHQVSPVESVTVAPTPETLLVVQRQTWFTTPVAIALAGLFVAAAIVVVNGIPQQAAPLAPIVIQDIEEFETPPNVILPPNPEDSAMEEYVDTLSSDTTDYSGLYKNVVQQPGVAWYNDPILRGNLKLINGKETTFYFGFQFNYYELGTHNGNPILFVRVPCDGMCFFDDYVMFVEGENNTYQVLMKHSSFNIDDDQYSLQLAANVTKDTTTSYSALEFGPIAYQGQELVPSGEDPIGGFFANSSFNTTPGSMNETLFMSTSLLVDTQYGPLYRQVKTEELEFGAGDYQYAVRTVGGLLVDYQLPVTFMSDDRVPTITWNDGTQNKTMYRMDGLGSCGWGGPEIAITPVPSKDLAVVGTTNKGETVYSLKNKYHPLITRVIEPDGTREVYDYNAATDESYTYTITPEEFIAERGVIIIYNVLGEQMILTNGKYGPQAECAKPVIYLYPEATTTISVKVDALITKSDPLYKDGWTVQATPAGSLSDAGGSYTSLFWDGYGNGIYPDIEQGFIIPTGSAMDVMKQHLEVMGFNEREIADFEEFWIPHLPKTPYVRFHWLQTAQMQSLAALTIEPRPQSFIRAFVDFVGVEEVVPITPQVITPRPRVGYTATEWGGILRK